MSDLVHSAGIIPAHLAEDRTIHVFAAHMGGPFWANRDPGAWSIAKGQFDSSTEDALAAAEREFEEEIGMPCPAGPRVDLGEFRQRSSKMVRAYTVLVEDRDALRFVASNLFEMEWPRGSGRIQEFPEMDAAEWMSLAVARSKILAGQLPILDAVESWIGRLR